MAYSREIFQWIKGAIQFEREDNEHDSHYTQIAGVYVRVSNHCTWMKTWENIFKLENGKYRNYKGKRILSLVFEDSGSTYKDECLYTEEYHETPIQVTEYVYATPLDKTQVNAIIKSLRGFEQGIMFQDTLGIAEKHDRVSVYPGPNNDGNSDKDYKEQNSKNITESKSNKHIIKTINENQLKQIVAEAVRKILNV
jgi:hypothetical protein